MKKSAALLLTISLPLSGEIENEFPLGIEAVTGIRSGYNYRGFQLASTTAELQVEAEISLSDKTMASFGLWHLSESSGLFSETGTFLDLQRELNNATSLGVSLTYHNFNNAPLVSGIDLGMFLSHRFHRNWDAQMGFYYDEANNTFYGSADLRWTHLLSDKLYLAVEGGISSLSNSPSSNGLNDFFGRLSMIYSLSEGTSFTPFIGWSVPLERDDQEKEIYAGMWFAFIF